MFSVFPLLTFSMVFLCFGNIGDIGLLYALLKGIWGAILRLSERMFWAILGSFERFWAILGEPMKPRALKGLFKALFN